jgi:hypothetical protein
MATLIPSYEKVLAMKVKPEEGELYLLKFLDKLDEFNSICMSNFFLIRDDELYKITEIK